MLIRRRRLTSTPLVVTLGGLLCAVVGCPDPAPQTRQTTGAPPPVAPASTPKDQAASAPSQPPPSQTSPSQSIASPPSDSSVAEALKGPAPEEKTQETTKDTEKTPPEPPARSPLDDSSPSSLPATPTPNATATRILLLTPGAPTLIDLQLELDGRPLGETFEELLRQVRRSADADSDGRVTWDELTAQRQVRAGFLGNMPLNDERARLEFARQYDTNANQLVDEDEWALVFRQQSSRGRVFGVENRDDHRDWNRPHSTLLGLLDSDGDRILSREECQATADLLLRLDANDDERIELFEVSASQVEIPGMPARSQRRSSGPYVLWHLSSRTNWDDLIRACQSTYSAGGPLAAGCFVDQPELFEAIDSDANTRISRTEIMRLAEIRSHARLRMRWGTPASEGSTAGCELIEWSDALGPRDQACVEHPDGVVLHLRGTVVELFRRETGGDDEAGRASAALARYDVNQNAYLDGDELTAAGEAFGVMPSEVDADSNDQITLSELTAFLRRQAAATTAQVRAVASHPEDACWVLLDQNSDGQLDGEEIARAGERLLARDLDGSNDISVDELPEYVWLAIVRGEVPTGLVRPVARGRGAGGELPAWFRSMDANGDGALSRREFLGDDSLFRRLDTNQNDKLELAEIQAE